MKRISRLGTTIATPTWQKSSPRNPNGSVPMPRSRPLCGAPRLKIPQENMPTLTPSA